MGHKLGKLVLLVIFYLLALKVLFMGYEFAHDGLALPFLPPMEDTGNLFFNSMSAAAYYFIVFIMTVTLSALLIAMGVYAPSLVAKTASWVQGNPTNIPTIEGDRSER